MKCPKCQQEMEIGLALIHASPLGAVLFGMSQEHLWFMREGEKAKLMIKSKSERPAERCTGCGLIVVETVERKRL